MKAVKAMTVLTAARSKRVGQTTEAKKVRKPVKAMKAMKCVKRKNAMKAITTTKKDLPTTMEEYEKWQRSGDDAPNALINLTDGTDEGLCCFERNGIRYRYGV